MTKYTDWPPASVFGSTVMSPATSELPSTSQKPPMHQLASSKSKVLLKKCELPSNTEPQINQVVNNNHEQCEANAIKKLQEENRSDMRVGRKKELAAMLLQRHVQVWLLKRQEIERQNEVQQLRGELRQAAAGVIRESYTRYVKRLAIYRYLIEVRTFESRLDELLHRCLTRKCRLEEVKHFVKLRKEQQQLMDGHKKRHVCEWLTFRVQLRRQRKEEELSRAHKMLLGWVRRWTLRKRCQARALTSKMQEEQRHTSTERIHAFYHATKLRQNAKREAQRRRRIRDGLVKLQVAMRLVVLRNAQFRWHAWICALKLVNEAVRKLQRNIRERQASARHERCITSCILLQCVFRSYVARLRCTQLRQKRHQEILIRRQNIAATVIQRHVRGLLTRGRFAEVLSKLRERFQCTNCGVIEPSGMYCKYCGRRRTTLKTFSNLLMAHKILQLEGTSQPTASVATEDISDSLEGYAVTLPPIEPPSKPQGTRHSHSNLFPKLVSNSSDGNGSFQPIQSLPAVLSPRHRRLVARNGSMFARSKSLTEAKLSLPRRNSIGEQTALRAAALADLQSKYTASAQMHAIEMHITRLQRASVAVNRGSPSKLA